MQKLGIKYMLEISSTNLSSLKVLETIIYEKYVKYDDLYFIYYDKEFIIHFFIYVKNNKHLEQLKQSLNSMKKYLEFEIISIEIL